MGTPVTVDSDDLEAILHAANVSVLVQQMMATATGDVAYKRCQPRFVEAAQTLNRVRAEAIRVPSPDESAPMTDAEFNLVTRAFLQTSPYAAHARRQEGDISVQVEDPDKPRIGYLTNLHDVTVETLRTKRLIQLGSEVTAIRWKAGQPWEEIAVPQMVFRLTARGEAEYERIERERRAAVKPYDIKPPKSPHL